MKLKLTPSLLIIAHLIFQPALFIMTGSALQKSDPTGGMLPTASFSQERVAQEITCAPDLTIARCITGNAKQGKFTTFAKLSEASGLKEVLNQAGPYTVFVPTDDAFSALGTKKVDYLSDADNRERTREIIYLHVVRGNMLMRTISQLSGSGATAVSLQGTWLGVAKEGKVNGARILKSDIEASNGIIHMIDTVILPDTGQPDAGPRPTEVVSATKNQQRTRTRVIKVNSWPNEPVKIVSVKLRGGEQIKPGVPFQAVDDWVRGLTLTMSNVSKKPVCFIHVQLHLPRQADDPGTAANDALMFACDPVNVPTPSPLMPGMSMDITLTDSDYEPHQALLERNGYPRSVSDVELKVFEVEFFGNKDRKWLKGEMMRRDPNSPGEWYPDRP